MLPSELAECVQIRVPFTGGLDESSAVDEVAIEDAIEMVNFRTSPDGTRIEKRLGSATQGLGESEDVYGYHTYYNSSSQFCQIAVLESEVKRKVSLGSWTSIHTWGSNIAHPVRPLEIQGKQYLITEQDSRMIHTDGNDYQIGITAPATVPTITTGYDTAIIEEDCADISDWADNDFGAGASTQATFDSKSCMKFLNTGSAGDLASRTRYPTNKEIAAKMALETSIYLKTIGTAHETNNFYITVNTGYGIFGLVFGANEVYVVNGGSWMTDLIITGVVPREDVWMDVKFVYDGSNPSSRFLEFWIDDDYKGQWTVDDTTATTPGLCAVGLYGETVATEAYVDYINFSHTQSAKLLGKYRYAVTYARSGNYGNESNPIKSLVGTASFTGSGLNDMTSGGTFTADMGKAVRVRIDGTGTPDTIEVSYDAGTSWSSTDQPITSTMYLSYGIILTWGATTGHTLGDYWDFTCSAIAVLATNEKLLLSSIPTSSDAQVDQRKIYRTAANGLDYFWLATINDNTTTTFVDNIPDSALGVAMAEDHDVLPNGKFSTWWDERLWVSGDNVVYYSDVDNPEAFDIDVRFITIRKGDKGNDITQMVDYKDALYVFKKNSTFIILKKPGGGYGRYLLTRDFGCIAPWSMIEVNNLLMFLSHRGIEVFNGADSYIPNFSVSVKRTISAIDTTKLDYICASHCRNKNEVWWSIPDDTSGTTKKTLVYNYISNRFYIFERGDTEVISCLAEASDSNKKPQVYIGTRSGKLFLAESKTQDGSSDITATIRKKWFDQYSVGTIRRFDIKYEIPSEKTLTGNFYVDFDKDVARTTSHTGASLNATDIELRRVIKDYAEFGLEGRWFCFELTNNENLGGDLKINEVTLYIKPRTIKGKKYGD